MGDSSKFPSTQTQVLTILYLQNQDLSKLTPSELLDKYYEVHNEIEQASKSK